MSSDIAIKVENLSKCFQIYEQPHDRLKQAILPRLHRLAGHGGQQYFREFWALKGLSFEVGRGETVGIIGRNGSGKSTLLQMICGTLNPTGGTISTHGRIAALLELGSGFNPEFTGRENVYMNAAVLGLSHNETEARFDAILAFADIGEFIEQPVKTYSSGMLVRLAFAVIAHVDADILVVDEALSVGDAFFTQKCMRFLRNFMKTGTVLFVSHDTAAVTNLCTRAILLEDGAVAMQGHPKDVIERYLASLYETAQDDSPAGAEAPAKPDAAAATDYRDMRTALFNGSTLRNDIEVFQFEPDEQLAGFGSGAAAIVSVRLLDESAAPLSWVVGGENVILEIRCRASRAVRPIIGFVVRDRLGQVIFADNTYLAYQFDAPLVGPGEDVVARFEFRMPVLPSGDYSFSPAIAEGTQDEHVQHHWVHDALMVRVHASSVCLGLMGVPMRNMTLSVLPITETL